MRLISMLIIKIHLTNYHHQSNNSLLQLMTPGNLQLEWSIFQNIYIFIVKFRKCECHCTNLPCGSRVVLIKRSITMVTWTFPHFRLWSLQSHYTQPCYKNKLLWLAPGPYHALNHYLELFGVCLFCSGILPFPCINNNLFSLTSSDIAHIPEYF